MSDENLIAAEPGNAVAAPAETQETKAQALPPAPPAEDKENEPAEISVSSDEEENEPAPPAPEIPANCKLVGIRFKLAGELFYIPDDNVQFSLREKIVVKLAKGKDVAEVALLNPMQGAKINDPHIRFIRKLNDGDLAQIERNKQREAEAFAICQNKIKKLELPMKLLRVQYLFDGSRVTFFFKADSKVDFRKLVRELAFIFRTRIELRQIGPREETEMFGGLGICGRRICCNYWNCRPKSAASLDNQKNPFLNMPSSQNKVSGLCSRPLCCLRYEMSGEPAAKLQVPAVNARICVEDKPGTLKAIDEGANLVSVAIDGAEAELSLTYEEFIAKIAAGKIRPHKELRAKPELPFMRRDGAPEQAGGEDGEQRERKDRREEGAGGQRDGQGHQGRPDGGRPRDGQGQGGQRDARREGQPGRREGGRDGQQRGPRDGQPGQREGQSHQGRPDGGRPRDGQGQGGQRDARREGGRDGQQRGPRDGQPGQREGQSHQGRPDGGRPRDGQGQGGQRDARREGGREGQQRGPREGQRNQGRPDGGRPRDGQGQDGRQSPAPQRTAHEEPPKAPAAVQDHLPAAEKKDGEGPQS